MSRSVSKGPYVESSLLDRVQKIKASGKREVIKTYKRASIVIPDMVGMVIAVHDGRRFISVFVTENMVGHSLGEFAPTRTFRIHSGQRKEGKEELQEGAAAPAATAPTATATTTPAAAPTAPAANK
jgi:small subunit ribosomal protein S19